MIVKKGILKLMENVNNVIHTNVMIVKELLIIVPFVNLTDKQLPHPALVLMVIMKIWTYVIYAPKNV